MKPVSAFDKVAEDAPALDRAEQLQEAAASVGFDWPDVAAVWEKVREEIAELDEALASDQRSEIQDELGDVLFALVNLVRKAGLDPAVALESTNRKFVRRFQAMERAAWAEGSDLSQESLERQLLRYRQAKAECLDH
ncbi:MAG: hypothetical protein PF483_15430 [Halothiobacillus sp.]|jgi:ATP diphosphatase|uniref:MazG nucleotide pyrophosphohydrolase domain-containing protein n=1 Tax=Halothiobacillus sp. TaxID=1891311 RepID=UPI002AD3695B|nr:MazG nucleotide pyrophosphohydrolase domain-containing protein [Halothiobacillus sp.]MDA3878459.1 hypothetical protein [Halothiobacillus sp.]